ncbi:MAG: hypothetical protein VX974_06270 [Pseudomonadota bacterium]|nr:hypothetical protein [Pseudomonadota bacterium]
MDVGSTKSVIAGYPGMPGTPDPNQQPEFRTPAERASDAVEISPAARAKMKTDMEAEEALMRATG